ncbi:cupin domain-containing protein [Methanosarcina sp. KYL-1]|uniref:cupin domain-containing protein n=1 Tax=Methanosarcina sp. KYL-1 TaxID=2602068 RepID=UPI0021016B46|nr:cupin domain-containing protein [Methanosarcina sp. KYL-1]MCQ1535862.1 cupin domain-containing protein [Methanosarcina sp. KYL-1]
MKYTRIYSDSKGTSHFEDRDIGFAEVNFAPPAPSLYLSAFQKAEQFAFCRIPAGWFGDWHPTPHHQFFFFLSGELEAEVSDGELRRFGPGSVVHLEDTGGKGHVTRVIGNEDVLAAVVQLPD